MEILSNRDATASLGGGRPARLLVADDNSNIQRMVAQTLKEHGIEVLAVGNGEAAVRSMAQVMPDLILADVFMPVRSGYEVCEYVKGDARFAHIPVVLLLGAFDPLDENEAKRVGADGVLKKPFVPPEPMIALVKALLEKSAPQRLAEAPVPVAVGAPSEPFGRPDNVTQRSSRAATRTLPLPPIEESGEIDYPPMGRDAFDVAAPAAAATEFHASAVTEIADEAETSDAATQSRGTALGEPGFWHPEPAEESTAESTEDKVEEGPAEVASHGFEPVHPSAEYFEAAVEQAAVPAPANVAEAADESRVEPFAQATGAESVAVQEEEPRGESDAQPSARTAEETKPEWAASPNDWLIASQAATQALAAAETVASHSEHAEHTDANSDWAPVTEPMVELSGARESSHDGAFAPASAVWSEPEPAATPRGGVESGAADGAAIESWSDESPAEAKSEKAGAPGAAEVAEEAAEEAAGKAAEQASESSDENSAETQSYAEVAPAEFDAAEYSAPESSHEEHADSAAPATASRDSSSDVPASQQTTDELVNAVVARVIEKLQPQLAAMINEQILKPVVSTLVRREIENKNDPNSPR